MNMYILHKIYISIYKSYKYKYFYVSFIMEMSELTIDNYNDYI